MRLEWLKDVKPATTDRYLEALRAAYRLAVKQKRIASDRTPYIGLIHPDNRRTGFVDEEVFWKLHGELSPASVFADVALFAYRSGWRREEIEGLTWEQIDLSEREARLWDSKNEAGRVLPLEGELWDVIERRQEARRYETDSGPALSLYVFHENGSPLGDWRKRWARACVDAGVGQYIRDKKKRIRGYVGLLFHDFRRSAARNLIRAGVPSVVVMAITGHKTRSMLDRYTIETTDERREALRATIEFLKGKKRSATEQVQS